LCVALGKPQAVISEEALEEMHAQENSTKQGHNRKPSRSRSGSSADDNNADKTIVNLVWFRIS